MTKVTDGTETENETPSKQVLEALKLVAHWRQDVEQSVSPLEQEIVRLKKEAHQRTVLAQHTLASFQQFANQGWECHWLALYAKSRPEIERFAGPEVLAGFAHLAEAAAQQSDAKLRRFSHHFEAACRGLPLDPESRHPRYTFEDGFFTLVVDVHRRVAKLTDYGGDIATIPADAQPLAERISQERDRVFGRPLDAETFLRSVRESYHAARAEMAPAVRSDSVPILSMVKQYKKATKRFRLDEFIINLSRTAAQRDLVVEGDRMEFQHTRDTKDALLLHGPNLHTYVGYIVFRKAGR